MLISLVPLVRMGWWIGTGTHVHWADYWVIVAATFNPDGSVNPEALVTPQGQHLLTVPQLVYWANIKVFGGSNISLGYFVLAVVVAQIALLWRWLASTSSIPVVAQAVLAAFVAVLLLSPNGAWNFLRSMSGTAWLTANLFALVAVHLMARDKVLGAVGCAFVATITYGTGLLAWPAIAAVAWWRHRRIRVVVPVAGAALVVLGGYALVRRRAPDSPAAPSAVEAVEGAVTVVGGLVSNDLDVAATVGWVVVVATVLVVLASWWFAASSPPRYDSAGARRLDPGELAPWLGLVVYGLGNAVLIGHSRANGPGGASAYVASRYHSVAAMVWIAFAVVAVILLRGRRLAWSPVLVVALLVPFLGTEEVRRTRDHYDHLENLANAQRIKVARGGRWFPFIEMEPLSETLEILGHHPFDGRHRSDCGLLDGTFEHEAAELGGSVRVDPDDALPRAVSVFGQIAVGDAAVDCVLLVDETGTVVGVGRAVSLAEFPARRFVHAFAPSGSMPLRLVVRFVGDGSWHEIPVAPVEPEAPVAPVGGAGG